MPFNEVTIRWVDISGQLARSTATVGIFDSQIPLWCKGSKRRREHQAKASISVQQDQDQPSGREEVMVEPK